MMIRGLVMREALCARIENAEFMNETGASARRFFFLFVVPGEKTGSGS